MYKHTLLAIGILLCSIGGFSQGNTCENPNEDPILDLNSITKCSVQETNRNTKDGEVKKVAVEVTSRRRIVRKRDEATGVVTNDYSHKLANMKKKITVLDDLSLEESAGVTTVPFSYVDEIPLFKACESSPLHLQEKCFKKQLTNHVRKNLKYPQSAYERGIQGVVLVYFYIDKQGNVTNMDITSPYKGALLGDEVKRIVKKLPKFKPGKHNGVPVNVKYGTPITFKIPGVKQTNVRKKVAKKVLSEVYTFDKVETIPEFKACKKSPEALKCFNSSLIKHIEDNFAYPQSAVDANIQGNVTVSFVINKKGEVLNVSAKGPTNGKVLEAAAIKLVEKLPKFKPAEINGKSVNSKYSFPISFVLN